MLRSPPAEPGAIVSRIPEIRPEQSIELLKELHLLTRDGRLNQDSRRKLKQVYHLVGFIEPLIAEAFADNPEATLVDHGAGKSYLGFILYDLVFKARPNGRVVGVETRAELVDKSRRLAATLGFARMDFHALSVDAAIASAALPARVDLVTALHACDTATDDAIRFALSRRAKFIALVPCCQAEVAAELRKEKAATLARTPLAELWRRPLHTREFGTLLTNTLRCLQLEAAGYQVSVTELTGWEHSLKNELIVARHTGQRRGDAAARIDWLLAEAGIEALRERFSAHAAPLPAALP
jgi:hypothetical protein